MSKMKVEVIPCSATPLIYDEEKMYRLQRLCRDLPVRYYSAESGKRETSDRDVSGRMLLLWSLRDGMSEKKVHSVCSIR